MCVAPHLVGYLKGNQWVEVVTPHMYIADSKIPLMKKWNARGVFFGEFISKNTVVGVYGGPRVTRQYWLDVVRQQF